MALLIPDEGELGILTELTGPFVGYFLGLFTSAHIPSSADTFGTYAAMEPDDASYARQALNVWTGASADGSGRAITWAELKNFIRGGGGTVTAIHGYWVMDASQTLIRWAEVDPTGPAPYDTPGQSYSVIGRFTFRSQP